MEPGPAAAAADVPENAQKDTQPQDLVEKLAGRDALMGEKIKEAANVVCLVGVISALIIGLLIGERYVGPVGALAGFITACAGFTITAALVKTLYKYGDMVTAYVEQMKALREQEAQRALAVFISTPAMTESEAPEAEEETAAEEAPAAETAEEPVPGDPEADSDDAGEQPELEAQIEVGADISPPGDISPLGDTSSLDDTSPTGDTSPIGDGEDPGVYDTENPPGEIMCPFCGQTQPPGQNTCSYCGFQYTYNSGQDAATGISKPA
jgi:uncharacterized Zn-finger protein